MWGDFKRCAVSLKQCRVHLETHVVLYLYMQNVSLILIHEEWIFSTRWRIYLTEIIFFYEETNRHLLFGSF